jgi:hypothetical protein
LGNIQI